MREMTGWPDTDAGPDIMVVDVESPVIVVRRWISSLADLITDW